MEYTEEVIKEADSVVEKYAGITDYFMYIHCAIQDRQSVLDELKMWDEMIGKPSHVSYRILDLTQQIDYLKSKI